ISSAQAKITNVVAPSVYAASDIVLTGSSAAGDTWTLTIRDQDDNVAIYTTTGHATLDAAAAALVTEVNSGASRPGGATYIATHFDGVVRVTDAGANKSFSLA